MKLKINEAAKLSGVTVRTLHYYDQIGLLKPEEITDSGYRIYGDRELEKLQQILFFRELDFPLEEIREILNHPSYSRTEALRAQKELLRRKKKRLSRLICLIDRTLEGEEIMSFKEFGRTEIEDAKEKYAKEARERWGGSEAYLESERRTGAYGPEDWMKIQGESEAIFREFSALRGQDPACEPAQALVKRWQDHIGTHFYPCTNEILSGLGAMYTADERFRNNIDQYGEGTAELMARSIAVYCGE